MFCSMNSGSYVPIKFNIIFDTELYLNSEDMANTTHYIENENLKDKRCTWYTIERGKTQILLVVSLTLFFHSLNPMFWILLEFFSLHSFTFS